MNLELPEIRYHSKEFGSSIPVAGMSPGHNPELKKLGVPKKSEKNCPASGLTDVILEALD